MDYNEWTSSRMESDISQYVSWRGGNGERERGGGRESISLDLQEGERERDRWEYVCSHWLVPRSRK